MDINSLHKNNMIAIPQKEQGLAWLMANGPLLENPPLPMIMLRGLVADRRVLRLRRGLYLAPTPSGRLPSLPRAINLADPTGYISGHGALMLHNLNDQDIARWYSVSAHRQGDFQYGESLVHFVLSPSRTKVGLTTVEVRGESVRLATIARALIDELDLMPFGLNLPETTRILRLAVLSGRATEQSLINELRKTPSVAAGRRLGFLLELITGHQNPSLLALAHSKSGVTRQAGGICVEPQWRLRLPQTRTDILRASR
jgi:predicted transcriptional regulator of viral defense system